VASRDDRLLVTLQKVAPGTALREGVDRIMRAGKGAIIVLGAGGPVDAVVSGGFRLDTKFTAQRLSEVAKMDGAIVLDEGVERILWANVHLVPDSSIPTSETGTRHRTSERVARQTGVPVVCVSESMRLVNLYVDEFKHTLEEISSILFRANQALATLERYRGRLDETSAALSALEVEDIVTLRDVLAVLQRAEMVRRIADEIERSIAELGTDGRLLSLQLDELLAGVSEERLLVVRDYLPRPAEDGHTARRRTKAPRRRAGEVLAALDQMPAETLLELDRLAEVLGYGADHQVDEPVSARGYRLLSRIPRLPDRTVDALVARFASLPRLLSASLDDLDAVEGIGETRARMVKEGLTRLSESSILEPYA
jgi:diadenylate cyclase